MTAQTDKGRITSTVHHFLTGVTVMNSKHGPLAGPIIAFLNRHPNVVVTIDDLVTELNRDRGSIQTTMARIAHKPEVTLECVERGSAWIWRGAKNPPEIVEEPESTEESDTPFDPYAADVDPPEAYSQQPPLYEYAGKTAAGTILVKDESGVFYVLKALDA